MTAGSSAGEDPGEREVLLRLSKDQTILRDLARDFAEREFSSKARTWDRENSPLPTEARLAMAGLDFTGIPLPAEIGGLARPLIDGLIVLEEIAKVCQLAAWPIFEATTGAAR